MVKYLGIDYGLERTGLAITDPEGKIAFPLATLTLASCKNRKNLLDKLTQLALENNVEGVVLGLPINEDGSENTRCRQVRNFAQRLAHRLSLPIYFISEYLSTQIAEEELRSFGKKGVKLKRILDQQAACIILENFIYQR